MSRPYDDDRVTAELHRAAESFEPDAAQIRRLMDAGLAGETARASRWGRVARGGRDSHRALGDRRHGRPLLWPAAGFGAAASVILAVFAAATPIRHLIDPPTGPGQGTITVNPAGAASSTTSGASSTTGAPTGSGSPGTATTGSPPGPGSSSTTKAGGSRSDSASRAPSGTSGIAGSATAPASGSGAVIGNASTSQITMGGRQFTVSVQPVAPGRTAALGGSGTERWVVGSAVQSAAQPVSAGSGAEVGPIQLQGAGAALASSPFVVSWRGGRSPAATGTATAWLTAPALSNGAPSGLRVPVRFRSEPVTATLYLGTTGGRGKLTITLPAAAGQAGGVLPVTLPSCSTGCGMVVVITVRARASGLPSTGDLTLDLTAVDAGARVGIAAATLR